MNTENYLKELKKEYEQTDATWHLKMSGWGEIEKRISLIEPKHKRVWRRSYAFGFAVVLVFVFVLFSAYKTVLASVPGDTFYPVKVLSEKISQKLTGSNQSAIDHRAQEIIELSKKQNVDKSELKQVVSEYKSNVEEAQKSDQNLVSPDIKLQKDLEKQHTEFDKIVRSNPDVGAEIKDAQDVSGNIHHQKD